MFKKYFDNSRQTLLLLKKQIFFYYMQKYPYNYISDIAFFSLVIVLRVYHFTKDIKQKTPVSIEIHTYTKANR